MAATVNIKEVQAALANVEASAAPAMRVGLWRAGRLLQRLSMKLVPIQTGNLRGSADTLMKGSGLQSAAEVIYATEYALFVHENLDAAHGTEFNTKHADAIAAAGPAGGKYYFNRGAKQQAKFLETPLRENRNRLKQLVEDALAEGLGGI
jgi:hypothetical protein